MKRWHGAVGVAIAAGSLGLGCARTDPVGPSQSEEPWLANNGPLLTENGPGYMILVEETADVIPRYALLSSGSAVLVGSDIRGTVRWDLLAVSHQGSYQVPIATLSSLQVCGHPSWMVPVAVNNRGDVLADCRDDAVGSGERAYVVWRPDGSRVNLGFADAFGMNQERWVVGINSPGRLWHGAAVWTPDGERILIGREQCLFTGGACHGGATADAVNDDGLVIGHGFRDNGAEPVVFLWSPYGGLEEVTDLFPPSALATMDFLSYWPLFTGLNNAGVTVGDGFLWSKGDGYVPIPIDAVAINEAGKVAGNTSDGAAIWTKQDGLLVLTPSGRATDINNRGDVIGIVPGVGAVIWKT